MEYINYLVTSFNRLLFSASNLLNKFKHAKCGKLKSKFDVSLFMVLCSKISQITANT